ncbi:MAG: phosphatase PAP2 family protein, partial [Gemmatimonadaceae bacterium]
TMISNSKSLSTLAAALVLSVPLRITAQTAYPSNPPSEDSAGQPIRMLTRADAARLLVATGIVLVAIPNDRWIASRFQGSSGRSNRALNAGADVFDAAADPGVLVFSAASYFLGLATHSRPVTSLGMHTGEAIVMGGVITQIMKGSFGRARPSISPTDSRDFEPGKGFGNDEFGSFPSGEVTIAFAAATAASREVTRSWPGAARYVTPASYGAATLVGVARLYGKQHWASDVVAGATVGTVSGILFDRYNRRYPGNVFNRVFLPASVVPDHGRIEVAWLLPLQ